MPYRGWEFRIDDILEAIDKIERYTDGIGFKEWQQDDKTVDAVVRNIEVIGEAASHLPVEIQDQYKDIPWSMMKRIRNVLAHEYFGIDLKIIWKTVKEDLPALKKLLEK